MANVVVDASTIASAALKADSISERAVLFAIVHPSFYLSEPVVEEIREVLGRPKFRKYITDERRATVIASCWLKLISCPHLRKSRRVAIRPTINILNLHWQHGPRSSSPATRSCCRCHRGVASRCQRPQYVAHVAARELRQPPLAEPVAG